MASNSTQYNAGPEQKIRRVWMSTAGTAATGDALCYNELATDNGTTKTSLGHEVEQPTTGNLNCFAGVVAESSDGVVTPGYIDMVAPENGQMARAKVTGTMAANAVTLVGPVAGSSILGIKAGTSLIGLPQVVANGVTAGAAGGAVITIRWT